MQTKELGSTGIRVSVVSFGAGPIPALLTAGNSAVQRATVARALELGINWFDTAATYADGQSELNLGRALHDLGAGEDVHVATKVRLEGDDLSDITGSVRRSLAGSLERLQLPCVSLLQLHNSVTFTAGALPTSLSPGQVLSAGGVLDGMRQLQDQGLVRHLGLTALGEPAALLELLDTGCFQSIQIPYNMLNSSAGRRVGPGFSDTDYGDLITTCGQRGIGAFAIRVFAGGALLGRPPSAHTLTTRFFPLDLYERDSRKAAELAQRLPPPLDLSEAGVRFCLSHPHLTSAIIGLSEPEQVERAVASAAAGVLDEALIAQLNERSDP